MSTLRTAAIRLAAANPGPVRAALLPLLKKTAAGNGYELLIETRGGQSKVKKFKNKTQAEKWAEKNGDKVDGISWPSERDEENMDLS
jgi:hypothetical protein